MPFYRTRFSIPLSIVRAVSILTVALSGFAQQPELPIQPPPGEERVEQMRQRLEETTDERMRSTLLMQMLYQLQNLGAVDEAMEIYEEMLQTQALRDPTQHYQHLRNLGGFLESQGRPRDALRYYDRFLQSLPKGALPGQYESFRADMEARRLSALFSSGDYRSVKTAAFEILEATGKPSPRP
jgi:tetratricopeptide (TPR) repeat protein